ncbi:MULTISPECIES: exodeoxyribonuclease VII large subunit [unclassified Polaromonas]|uniref:exodeoxyribonuclease VII large subunit n=1 Tax=unclassified Polaromonas TaxID=2638319 RepID=UPI000F07E18F|nr:MULTISPECIES: exodeoxyribonuclease VII large subunit [unclassified Polaromonas]AYQ29660.1 exodeoxyribonuclease VII large subunit [Polaromonas sp. SP1]QGJ19227.1 exodeoxyribonuclease VII large subunit [Polaromonas sp. Pch-P]
MFEAGPHPEKPFIAPREVGARIWPVGSLLRAIADSLEARFNPVAVQGEISGFSRAASGHCYFSLKDEQGQVRCAMFRRAAGLLDFSPRDGQLVELRGRLGVYEPRGELQLVVESMRQAGQGNLFEQFLQLKTRLEAEGLFEPGRKRPLPLLPRAIGVVTSLGAAALHDVVSALQRRVPHIPVVIYPASVQGGQAAGELRGALLKAFQRRQQDKVDVLLLVRGGGAIEDLWAFNDEQLARTIVEAPMPVISGVGHETDFTIADFCADLRAPTPTAAAELCAQPQSVWLGALGLAFSRLQNGVDRQMQSHNQRLDWAASRVSRPSHLVTRQHARLAGLGQNLNHAVRASVLQERQRLHALSADFPRQVQSSLQHGRQRVERAQLRLELLDPKLVLKRGYAWLADLQGQPITSPEKTHVGQPVRATLAGGEVDLTVSARRLI